ncbi:uncharacterized protein LOC115624496 [Scaptodrosophila lebanonensis]|uniref:Uncharacterized protein LOC115624496 n=1 Tax=Drosophila lebanonensis TaxID=7225 RepID=A0A6J2THY0_DROLE|nr:uncharacterized protein LOC115624496 [Scaptodrosophila lebanonensis]
MKFKYQKQIKPFKSIRRVLQLISSAIGKSFAYLGSPAACPLHRTHTIDGFNPHYIGYCSHCNLCDFCRLATLSSLASPCSAALCTLCSGVSTDLYAQCASFAYSGRSRSK